MTTLVFISSESHLCLSYRLVSMGLTPSGYGIPQVDTKLPGGGDGGGSEWMPEITDLIRELFSAMILWLPWILVVGLIIAFYIFWRKHKKVLDRLSESSYNAPPQLLDPQEELELSQDIDFFIEEHLVLQKLQKDLEEQEAQWAKQVQENDLRPRRK